MRNAFKTFLLRSRRLARPAVALAGGVSLVALAKHTCHAEMKPAAVEMKNVFPSELIESRNLHNLMKYADSNGNISLEYFTMAMNELGVHNADVVQSFFRTMDTDGNGSVSFEEFVAGIAAIGSDTAEPLSRLKFVFQSCDLNGNGVVQKEELRKMIHALLVTRENLWIYEKRSEIDRQLSRELSKDLEMNVFDEWHKAVLIRQDDDDDDEAFATNVGGGKDMDMDPLDKARMERMQQIYTSFPHLKGKPLNVCLASLAELFSSHILSEADMNKDTVITFEEFAKWADKGTKDAEFLFSLYKDFQIVEPQKTARTYVTDEYDTLWCL